MTTHARWPGIVVTLSWLGLSATSAAGGASKDIWNGAWTFEIDRQDRPWLGFYDTTGKTVFRIGCGTHFEIDAVYPGEAPKQDHTEASITIASGKTQMDFAGFTYAGPKSFPPDTTMFRRAWEAISSTRATGRVSAFQRTSCEKSTAFLPNFRMET